MDKNIGIAILCSLVLVLGVGTLSYVQMNDKNISIVDTDKEWDVSNSPLEQGKVFLDAYGNENKDSTYVHAKHDDGLKLNSYGITKDGDKNIIEIDAESGEGSQKGHILLADIKPSDIDRIRLELDQATYTTETCGCVVGDYI